MSLVTARLALLGERPKPGSRYLPELIGQIWNRRINPGRVFDLTLPLDEVAERYRTMGDVVWIPPGVKHWHGATPSTAMSHIAIQEVVEGKVVDWMEHVTDEQYRK